MTASGSTCRYTYTDNTGSFTWSCHRECPEDQELCLFHRPAREKSSSDVRDELLRAIGDDQANKGVDARRKQMQFVGLRVDTLDLESIKIDADDNHPIDLRGATISRLRWHRAAFHHCVRLDQAVVEEEADLAQAQFGDDLALEGAEFECQLDLTGVQIDGDLNVDNGTVSDLCASEGRILGTVSLCDASLAGGVSTTQDRSGLPPEIAPGPSPGFGAGGAELGQPGSVALTHCTIQGDLRVDGSDCWGAVNISGTTIGGACSFSNAEMKGDNEIVLEDISADSLCLADVSAGGVTASRARLNGRADLSGIESNFLNLKGAEFDGRLDLKGAICTGVTIAKAAIGGEVILAGADVTQDLELQQLRAGDDLTLSGVETSKGSVRLDRCSVAGRVLLEDAVIASKLTLTQATLQDDLRAEGLEAGGADLIDIDCSGDMDLTEATVKTQPNLRYATLHKQLRLVGVTLPKGLRAQEITCRDLRLRDCPCGPDASISLQGGTITEGSIEQSPEDGLIDLSNATLGEVQLIGKPERTAAPIEAIRFNETQFAGFNFSRHYEMLREVEWVLHSQGDSLALQRGSPPSSVIRQAGRLLLAPLVSLWETIQDTHHLSTQTDADGSEVIEKLQSLETTYQLAKNGASDVGDAKISGKLFLQEIRYRHLRYGVQALTSESKRLESAVSWVSLSSLEVTSKYGERASWVFWASAFTITCFAGMFYLLGVGSQTATTPIRALTLSLGSFITLLFQANSVTSGAGQLLSELEGAIGAFLLALFVFALTRSVHR